MNESKSKIISFRLSAELEALASAAAAAAGDKNASAWCQRLAVGALSKIEKSNQNDTVERSLESASANDLLKALSNLRRLSLDCFEMSLKNGGEQCTKFLDVVIASEEEWETISRNIGKPESKFSLSADEPTVAPPSPDKSENFRVEEKASEDRKAEELNSNEYLLFAEEMQNEVAELVDGEGGFPVFQNGRASGFGESATKNQALIVLPILDATGQTDAGKSI